MLTFGLILIAALVAALAVAGVRAHRAEHLLVLSVHAGGTFFFERRDTGRYEPLAAWQLPAAAARFALRHPTLDRPVHRSRRPAPALARA